jgi:hypothetical protein
MTPHRMTEGMFAAVLGDFDMVKLLVHAEELKNFRAGDRFVDRRRERVRFLRAWKALTRKPLALLPTPTARHAAAAVVMQDLVRTAMENCGLWKLPCAYGRVVSIQHTKNGDRMTVEYDDGRTKTENFIDELPHLDPLVRAVCRHALFCSGTTWHAFVCVCVCLMGLM